MNALCQRSESSLTVRLRDHERGTGLLRVGTVTVQSAENPVTNRVGDVEVVTRHQPPIMVGDVMLPQPIHVRQSSKPRIRIAVVGEVQQLIVQEIQNGRQHEQETDIRRDKEIQQRTDGYRETADKEEQKDGWEQDRFVIPGGIEGLRIMREERMMLDRMTLEDPGQEPRLVVHGSPVPEVLAEVGVEKRQRNRQPFEQADVLEHKGTAQRDCQADADRGREVQRPGVSWADSPLAKSFPGGDDSIH